MRLDDVKKIGLLGGGVMGGGLGQVLAVAGYDAVIRDLTDDILEETREAVFESRWGMKRAVEIGKLEFDAATEAMQRISFTTELADLAECDFIIEAIPEDLELKQKAFKELDEIVNPEAIFTSNTSGFVIADIARDVSEQRKRQFAGMHYANPAPAMRMCEVIYTPQSSEETLETVRGVAERAGKVVCMVKDAAETYGFILNRVFDAAHREADRIVEAGIATKEDVDKAMITGRNWPAAFYEERGGIGQQW